ncbi:MAG: tetratricopeptide repeat protein [Planctomycetota bacterium]
MQGTERPSRQWQLTILLSLPALLIALLFLVHREDPVLHARILRQGESLLSLGLSILGFGLLPLGLVFFAAYPPAWHHARIVLGKWKQRLYFDRKAERDILLRLEQFENAPDLTNLGQLYVDAGMLDRAAPVLSKACEMDPGDARVHFLIARALAAAGQVEPARVAANRALALDADIAFGRCQLLACELALRAGDPTNAFELASAYRGKNGDNIQGLLLLARAAHALDNAEERNLALSRLLEIPPTRGKRFSPEEALARVRAKGALERSVSP